MERAKSSFRFFIEILSCQISVDGTEWTPRTWWTVPISYQIFLNTFSLHNKLFWYTYWYVLRLADLMCLKANINFKIPRWAENLTADTITSDVDTTFKYFMVIWDSVPIVDTICCLIYFKAFSFNIYFFDSSFDSFKKEIKKWKPTECSCRICLLHQI